MLCRIYSLIEAGKVGKEAVISGDSDSGTTTSRGSDEGSSAAAAAKKRAGRDKQSPPKAEADAAPKLEEVTPEVLQDDGGSDPWRKN